MCSLSITSHQSRQLDNRQVSEVVQSDHLALRLVQPIQCIHKPRDGLDLLDFFEHALRALVGGIRKCIRGYLQPMLRTAPISGRDTPADGSQPVWHVAYRGKLPALLVHDQEDLVTEIVQIGLANAEFPQAPPDEVSV